MTNAVNLASAAGTGFSFRNRIINGGFEIAQRGTSISSGVNAITYTLDRWIVAANGAAITAAQGTQTSPPYAYLTLTGASGNTLFTVRQRIEAKNIRDLANGPVTVSFSFYNTTGNATGLNVGLYYANAEDNFSATTLISSQNLASNTSTARQSFTFTLPDGAKNGVELIFTGTALTSGIAVLHTVQLEAGSVSTPFERRPHSLEFSLCQRYFETGNEPEIYLGGTSMNALYLSVPFKVTKRVAPTVTPSNWQYWAGGSAASTTPAIAFVYTGQFTAQITGTGISGYYANTGTWTASAEL